MSNPFKKNSPANYSEYIRVLFENKKEGDTFIVETFDISKAAARATIYSTVKQKYQTRFKDGKLYVLILDGERTNAIS